MNLFPRPSLRARFLIAPALGLVLMFLLILGFLHQSNQQRELIDHLVTENRVIVESYTGQFTELSSLHLDIYALLNSIDASSSEGIIYDRGKQTLNRIHQIIDSIRTHNYQSNLTTGEVEQQTLKRLQNLKSQLTIYLHQVTQAVEMSTVDLGLATTFLSKANNQYILVKSVYTGLINKAQQHMNAEIEQGKEMLDRRIFLLSLTAVISAIGLMFLSSVLSRLLSKSLRSQIAALDDLTKGDAQIDRRVDVNEDEIDKLSRSVFIMKESLQQVRKQEEELELTNRLLIAEVEERKGTEVSLQKAVDSLKLIQSQLEDRVTERTQSLSNANKSLLNEVSERKKAEQRLQIYQQVIEHTGEAVMITTPSGTILEVNPAYIKMMGYDKSELLDKGMDLVKSGKHSDDFYRSMWVALGRIGHWSGEIWNRRKDGEIFPQWVTINAVLDDDGHTQFYVGIFRDISDLKKAEQKLERLAFYDPLTGLPNRALFNDRLSSQILTAARKKQQFAVLFIDLDRFKYVNDTLGHSAGDKLLIEVSNRIHSNLRETDTVARMGGDEFTVIAESIHSEEDAINVAQKIISAIQQPITLGEQKFYVSASIGIGLYPHHGTDVDTLKKHSDMAMYRAKEMGRSQAYVFEHTLSLEKSGIATLATDIVNALERDEFYLNYQPIININSGIIIGAEVLIRWNHPEKGEILPGRFIPYAEELGMIGRIDQWVLNKACKEMTEACEGLDRALPVLSVNMSSSQFQQEDTPKMLSSLIESTAIPADKLNLEITETAVISNPEVAGKVLQQIKEIGVGVSIDDFGTGYSSLSYLTRYPVSRIKIDQSFVAGLPKDDACEAVVRSILRLAESLSLEVVAEGVETEQQHAFLKSAGCSVGQGYLYGKPQRIEKLIPLLPNKSHLSLVKS